MLPDSSNKTLEHTNLGSWKCDFLGNNVILCFALYMNNIRHKHLTDLLSEHPSTSLAALLQAPNVLIDTDNDVDIIDSILNGL